MLPLRDRGMDGREAERCGGTTKARGEEERSKRRRDNAMAEEKDEGWGERELRGEGEKKRRGEDGNMS